MTKCPRARSEEPSLCLPLYFCGGPAHFCVCWVLCVSCFGFWVLSYYFLDGGWDYAYLWTDIFIGLGLLAGVLLEYRMSAAPCALRSISFRFWVTQAGPKKRRSQSQRGIGAFLTTLTDTLTQILLRWLSTNEAIKWPVKSVKIPTSFQISVWLLVSSVRVPKISFTCVCHTCHLCFYSSFVSWVSR